MMESGYSDVVIVGEKPSNYSPKNKNIWPDVKPFVSGGLAGLLWKSLGYSFLPFWYHSNDPKIAAEIKKHIPSDEVYKVIFKRMPGVLLYQASYHSLLLGSFEILTRKVEAANNGMTLTLFQEACCGLTSGAIASYFGTPFYLAFMSTKGTTCPSIFQHLYHKAANEGVLALWKGGRPYANSLTAWNMGMLAPYNPSYIYFRESRGLSETRAIIGASAVSGFFASACCYPFLYVDTIMKNMKPDANGKYPYSSSLNCAHKIFKSRGSLAFFTGFPKFALKGTPRVMVLWYLFEKIRKHEESIGMFHRKEREIFSSEGK